MSHLVAQAIFATFRSTGQWAAAAVVGLCFHCVCRPDEVMSARWRHIRRTAMATSADYPQLVGVLAIERPKMRRAPHSRHQFASIECEALMDFLCWLKSGLSPAEGAERLWPGSAADFSRRFAAALQLRELAHIGFTPAGLRAGGATHHFLTFQDVPRIRRRGRWLQERTLEHYLQEGVYALQLEDFQPQVHQRLVALARLAGQFARSEASPARTAHAPPLGRGGVFLPRVRPPGV